MQSEAGWPAERLAGTSIIKRRQLAEQAWSSRPFLRRTKILAPNPSKSCRVIARAWVQSRSRLRRSRPWRREILCGPSDVHDVKFVAAEISVDEAQLLAVRETGNESGIERAEVTLAKITVIVSQ